MSTKALEVALTRLEEHATTDCQSRQQAEVVQRECAAAWAELEHIRKAAKEWADVDGQPGPGRMRRLDELLRAIAKEAP